MRISERIKSTIEDWRVAWGTALRNFLVAVLSFGFETFMDVLGKAASPQLRPLIDTLEKTGKVPPELQPLLNELKQPKGEVAAMFANQAGGALIGGAIGKIVDAILLPIAYAVNAVTRNVELNPSQYLALWLRGKVPPELLAERLSWLGYDTDLVDHMKALTEMRLDPMSIVTAWRRDKAKYGKLFQDLKDQGWDNDRIDILKFVTQFFPTPQDLITWQAREVFEPDAIEKYGLADEFEKLDLSLFEKAGVTREQALNYWMAHWEHASWMQVVEMLHRGQLKEEDVWDWFRLVEIPPFWRDKLIAISWNVPTRVDVRRWWDMRTISEARLKEIYEWQGYHGKDLDDYVLWTKVYVAFPDLIARFKNGWITEAEVKGELISAGMPSDRVEEMWQAKFAKEKPAQVDDERKATATEIMKGVKNAIISEAEGIEMLRDLGYDEDTSRFKLQVYGAIATGSPESYTEYKQLTQLYRKSIGLPSKIPPAELAEAEKALLEAEAELKRVIGEGMKEEKLLPYYKAKDDAAYRYRQLLAKWRAK